MSGMVYLVGAGPGDPGLLTMKAAECVKKAEVVVYDRLADDRILSWAPPQAEYIYVGKASANHAMKQEGINQLLVDKAKEGKCVVRLKGGDPFVFGRGGEEALLLQENGVPFEIVPGVTSAISVPAYAGIPVTHRAVATSFAVITGHEDPTKGGSNMRWDKLSTGVDTLVFLMGVANLGAITEKLIANGRPATTPAAVIRWGTKPEQETLLTTVGTAAADVQTAGLKPPAIFVVGDVVNLRQKLSWFDNKEMKPLFGKTVLVTRSRSQASRLSMGLEALGARVVELPAIRFAEPSDHYEAVDAAISLIASYDWILFTSVNGVDCFFDRLLAAGKDARDLARTFFACIGKATAARLRQYGLVADVVPDEFRAEAMIEALRGQLAPGERVLVPRAQEAREILSENLRAYGAIVDVAPVYRTLTAEEDAARVKEMLAAGEIDAATFASSSTVRNLAEMIGGADLLKNTNVVAIGPVTADTCEELGVKPAAVAKEYTIDGLIAAVETILR
ncbi:MAG: uroporphyrinogen-III C-methyltransferase [Schwartzia sp.]|nr:uroporphyrinogen-III C-methyltransferase [Schwartzia sp. (in: firmicutes)]